MDSLIYLHICAVKMHFISSSYIIYALYCTLCGKCVRDHLIISVRCMRSWGQSEQRQQSPRLAGSWLVWASPLKCRTDPLRSFQVAGGWEYHSPGMKAISSQSRKLYRFDRCQSWVLTEWIGYLWHYDMIALQSSVHGAHPVDAGRANQPPRPQCCHLAQQVMPHFLLLV